MYKFAYFKVSRGWGFLSQMLLGCADSFSLKGHSLSRPAIFSVHECSSCCCVCWFIFADSLSWKTDEHFSLLWLERKPLRNLKYVSAYGRFRDAKSILWAMRFHKLYQLYPCYPAGEVLLACLWTVCRNALFFRAPTTRLAIVCARRKKVAVQRGLLARLFSVYIEELV